MIIRLLTLLAFLCTTASYAVVKVVVIDTGLDLKDKRFEKVLCKSGHKDFTGAGIEDAQGHGSHVSGLIMKYAGNTKYCMVIVKFSHDRQATSLIIEPLRYALSLYPKYINISAGGYSPSNTEYELIKQHPDTKVIAAAGNDGIELSEERCFYPACYPLPNIITVGSLNDKKERYYSSNYGIIVKFWEMARELSTLPNGKYGYMTGTSMAAATHTGKLIKDEND